MHSCSCRPETRRPPRAFTLVELVIVVLILGILAAVAAPNFFDVSRQAEINAMMTECKTILSAVELCRAMTGEWPGDQMGGAFPPELAPYLDSKVFTDHQPLTGIWDWSLSEHGLKASLALVDWTPDLAVWTEVDSQFDDGDVGAGRIRTVNAYGGYFLVFVVDE